MCMVYKERYEQWLQDPRVDEGTRTELLALYGDEKAIEDRFYRELEFGTAGLRGKIAAGENRMNAYVVRRATEGLAKYLKNMPQSRERGVVIAYDSRRFSKEFALETALVLSGNGIKTYLFDSLRAVPQLSFAVRHLHCLAGVVITASHNPPEYNGYKVYWEHGGQISPDQASAVMDAISAVPWFENAYVEKEEALRQGLLTMIGKEVDEAYYKKCLSLLLEPELMREKGGRLKLVYTPLFGTGSVPVQTLLKRAGATHVEVVAEQAYPNGDFPGLNTPNPEDPAAFTLAMALADKTGADAILATDPDADRLGMAVRDGSGQFQVLTGNEIGCILLYHILSARVARGDLPKNALVVKSIVSTHLADAICAHFGVEIQDVLTGFRFISEKIHESSKTGTHTFLFGFEESFGFLSGEYSRDKDAISSAMLAAEACVSYRERGMTLYDGLQEIYRLFGFYHEKVQSYTLDGKEGMEKIASTMSALREAPICTIGKVPISWVEDYQAGIRVGFDQTKLLTLPKTNMLRFLLQNDAWICIRPSGTEPKLKLYIGAKASDEAGVNHSLHTLYTDMDARLRELLDIR